MNRISEYLFSAVYGRAAKTIRDRSFLSTMGIVLGEFANCFIGALYALIAKTIEILTKDYRGWPTCLLLIM